MAITARFCCVPSLLSHSQAPYRRDLPGLFFGEELLQLQRLWCAGWDVFTPPTAVAFHLWSRNHRPTQRPDEAQRRRSQQRVAAVLAGEGEEAPAGGTTGGEGVGCRSIEQFWRHVGVDFAARTVSERAANGGMPPGAFLPADLAHYC